MLVDDIIHAVWNGEGLQHRCEWIPRSRHGFYGAGQRYYSMEPIFNVEARILGIKDRTEFYLVEDEKFREIFRLHFERPVHISDERHHPWRWMSYACVHCARVIYVKPQSTETSKPMSQLMRLTKKEKLMLKKRPLSGRLTKRGKRKLRKAMRMN